MKNTKITQKRSSLSVSALEIKKNKCHRISRSHYIHRGFLILCVGYYQPEHRVCWEAVDVDGSAFAHGYTLKEVKRRIDIILDE